MPSQPDMTQAYALSPHLKPKDKAEELQREKELLVRKLAEATGSTPEEIIKELEQEALPAAEKPLKALKAKEEGPAAAPMAPSDAKFFAKKEGTKYFPIEQRAKHPFTQMKEENVIYFKTKEEAEAESYVAG